VTTRTQSRRCLEVRRLALELMARHGLRGWSFAFNRSKLRLGLCRYGPQVIELSIHFIERNSEASIRDTLLHEIAHALAGRAAGHGSLWQTWCRRLGANPERLSFDAQMPQGRWQARCPGCGMLHDRHRKPKWMRGWSCRRCGPERGQLTWAPLGA
jgi:predicted SprT family Zn-dependent metalloprotease